MARRKPASKAPTVPARDRLDPKHAAALDLRLRGMSWRKIEAEIKVDHETVRRWSMSPKWQREAERRRAAVEAEEMEERRALRATAWATIRAIVDDEEADPRVRLDAAKTLLDRTGAPAGSAVDVKVAGGLDLSGRSDEELQAIVAKVARG